MTSRPKRIIVTAALILMAVSLNWLFCEWWFGGTTQQQLVVGHSLGDSYGWGGGYPFYGVAARYEVNFYVASLVGLLLPILILFALAYLHVHWREQSRVHGGRCLACGHALAGAARCPECGAVRVAS